MVFTNMSNVTEATNMLEYVQAANTLTNDWIGILFILGVFILIWLSITINTGEPLKGLVASSFVGMIISGFFYMLDLVNQQIPLYIGLVFTISLLIIVAGGWNK
jgi:hypothetical protein